MRRAFSPTLSLSLTLAFCASACEEGGPEGEVFLPDVEAATFVAEVTNPYSPMPVGATWSYEADTGKGIETVEVEVLEETRDIQGVSATVVRDTALLDDVLVEDTWDWFAQDSDGNVWYLGEDTCEYENDECVDTHGAWEWGEGGALPGIVMPGNPQVDGQPYYQEYDLGEAEDVGEVVEVDLTLEVPAGSFSHCIKTHETSTLDPELDEYKYFCEGIGLTLVEEPDFDVFLVGYSGL